MAIGVQITFDAHDTRALAEFWALALGYVLQPPPPGFASWEAFAAQIGIPEDQWDRLNAAVDPDGVGPRVLFQKVPEGKTVKNRVHLDVNVGAGRDDRRELAHAHRERLEAAGARFLREVDEPAGWCLVMADPEGNEFCLQ
jgi:hypothetical protein